MLKEKIGTLLLVIIGIYSCTAVQAGQQELPLLGKVIYLDPGHGGADPGALYKEVEEQAINLKIVEKLSIELEHLGAIVYQTRYGDYDLAVPHALNRKRSDLSRRANLINRSLCDLYLSIHLNAETSSSWKGAEVYYDDIHPDNEEIAKIMQEVLKEELNSRRTYKETSEMYLHKRVERPGVLIEVGFLSNPNERYLLKTESYQQKIADAITIGIRRYFKA